MSKVYFDEQNEFTMRTRNALGQRQPSMVQFVLKTGITKSERVAVFILLVFACVMIFATYRMLAAQEGTGIVTDRFGEQITSEEYIERLRSGFYE